ncbi:hypothetical protein ACH4MA_33925 [Streptomyces roseolus]|uniref:hypothetical protein n=1 Tax=Streptomyces roseolus TaxID=67358 RepID=UPI0037B078AF
MQDDEAGGVGLRLNQLGQCVDERLSGRARRHRDDSLRQTCIDVLCAYLRLPFLPDPGTADLKNHHLYLALREVRHTILRLIGDHYRRPEGTHHSWQGCDLDLTGVTIDGNMDFSDATFTRGTVTFAGATISGSTVSFDRAAMSGGTVAFGRTAISGGTVFFGGVTFSGGMLDFSDATGPVPTGLLAAVSSPVPTTVILP